MIIKKPYAFLIRHFRLIHLVLSAFLIFIAYKSSNIYGFFNDYVREGHYTYYPNLTSHFINYYLFIVLALITIIGIVLYILLKWKDKKTLFYVLMCVCYVFIFLIYIYFLNAFQNIEIATQSMNVIRVNRDFALLMIIPQFIFISISVLRSIGFDIKKFNFNKDLEDLSISIKDNEEVELILAKDTYKYMRTFRKILREIRYRVLESRFALVIISSLVVVVVGFAVFLSVRVYNKTYNETDNLYADTFNIQVVDSYLTNIDYNGKEINKNKYYVIIKLKMQNNNVTKQSLDLEKYKLIVNKNEYFPTITKINYFLDLGESYINQKLLSGKEYTYLLTYEIDKDVSSNNYIFRIVNDVSLIKGDIKSDNVNIRVKPAPLNEKIILNEFSVGDTVDLSDSQLKNSTVLINSYNIAKEFNESYKYCVYEKCNNGTASIKPQMIGNSDKYVLRLDTAYIIDSSEYISKYISNINDFMEYFASVNYILNGSEKDAVVKVINSKYTPNNIAFMEVPEEIKNAGNINLVITIRNINYKIKLK